MIAARSRDPDKRRSPLAAGSAQCGNSGNGIIAPRFTNTQGEAPEHNGERRRFICWALMLGAIPPERLTERVLDDVRQEAGAE